jgi:quercetin dioxygenase-like cupin family protein
MSVSVQHVFSGREYAKRINIPAGYYIEQHIHNYDHISILAKGVVFLTVGDSIQELHGPTEVVIVAGKVHRIDAITDSVWYCIHATEETDSQKVDATLIREA